VVFDSFTIQVLKSSNERTVEECCTSDNEAIRDVGEFAKKVRTVLFYCFDF